jgi:hypothetical protein
MSVESLNAFLTMVLDHEQLRLQLIHDSQTGDRLNHLVQLGAANGFDFTAADVVTLIAPGEDWTQGELEVFELGQKLRLIWYSANGSGQTIEFARPNDYDHIFNIAVAASEPLNSAEAILAIGFLAMVIDGERAPEEMQVLEGYLKHMGLAEEANQEVRRKIQRIFHQEGPGALFNAAKSVLLPEEIETAFTLAIHVVLADHLLMDEENDCLVALAQALGISDTTFEQLVANAIQHHTETLQETEPNPLVKALLDFLQTENWTIDEVEDTSGLSTSYQGQNGAWLCQIEAQVATQQILFYSICPITIPEPKRSAAAEFITRVNYELVIGNFEMSFDSGQVRYRTSLSLEGMPLSDRLLKPLVYANVLTMDQYLPGIQALLRDVSPEMAIAQIAGLDT